MKIKSLLLPFYFGSLDEQKRLLVERELLSDPETLLDYLDLKRRVEAAPSIPVGPSEALWQRLQSTLAPRKRLLVSISVGAAIAACLVAFVLLRSRAIEKTQPDHGEILFDVHSELPASSSVL